MTSKDPKVIEGFGLQWNAFDQSGRPVHELRETFAQYFRIFPWELLPADAVGADIGCGSGRWARFVADRVGTLVCIDASAPALGVAARALETVPNARPVAASAGELPIRDGAFDFGYSLGVLHHVPDPHLSLRDCVRTLKPGAPFLVYLYYALDNRTRAYRALWRAADLLRRGISRLPFRARSLVSQAIALTVYFPLARSARMLERRGMAVERLPLSAYRNRGLYAMRTDALDRFGQRIEHRFTAAEVQDLLERAGLENVTVNGPPYWCAVGYKRTGLQIGRGSDESIGLEASELRSR